nr:MAG TPA: hypothetical protein [Caudoviricetes sp.]
MAYSFLSPSPSAGGLSFPSCGSSALVFSCGGFWSLSPFLPPDFFPPDFLSPSPSAGGLSPATSITSSASAHPYMGSFSTQSGSVENAYGSAVTISCVSGLRNPIFCFATSLIMLRLLSDAIAVDERLEVVNLDLSDVRHVERIIGSRIDIRLCHDTAHRYGNIHANKAALVDISDHSVLLADACTDAEPTLSDHEVNALCLGDVVIDEVLHDGYGRRISVDTHHRAVDVREVRGVNEDVVWNGSVVVLRTSPSGDDCLVDVIEDLGRCLVRPVSLPACTCSDRCRCDLLVVEQPRRAVCLLSEIGVDVHVLVVVEANTIVVDVLDATPGDCAAQLVLNLDGHGNLIREHLIEVFAEIGLNPTHGVLNTADAIALSASHAVLNIECRRCLNPAAAALDLDVAGVGRTRQRLTKKRVELFELALEEREPTRYGCRIHCQKRRSAALRCNRKIILFLHICSPLLHALTRDDRKFCDVARICSARPLDARQLDAVSCLIRGTEVADLCSCGARSADHLRADINLCADLRRPPCADCGHAATLQHITRFTNDVKSEVLRRVNLRGLDLAHRNASKVCGSVRRSEKRDRSIILLDDRSAERDVRRSCGNGARAADLIALTRRLPRIAIGHVDSDCSSRHNYFSSFLQCGLRLRQFSP